VPVAQAQEALDALLARGEVLVERMTKSGRRDVDVRAAVIAAQLAGAGATGADPSRAIIVVVVRQVTPTVRPDDVVAALRIVAGLAPVAPPQAVRRAQGPLDAQNVIGDPLAADRVHVTSTP
jgi:hypothetical protein